MIAIYILPQKLSSFTDIYPNTQGSDVVVYDTENSRVAVFEAKYSKSLEQMESDCDAALQQIEEKMYAKEYEDEYDQILCYGIAFFKKRCLVQAVKND